jgi:hypothetical protein
MAPDGDFPTRRVVRAAPLLALDTVVRGSTEDPDPYAGAICTGGGTAGKRSAKVYRFVPPETGSYRIEVRAKFAAVVDVSLTTPGPQENRPLACLRAGAGTDGAHLTLRGGETYSVTIDGVMQAQGDYEVVARRDGEWSGARVQREDPAVVGGLVTASPVLALGRTLGTLASLPGGARAACGGLGTGTLYRVKLPVAQTLALHAVTQFPAALELRDAAGHTALACARSKPGSFEVALIEALPAGAYVLVMDTTDLAPELFDPLREFPIHWDVPGAGVRGGFVLDAAGPP